MTFTHWLPVGATAAFLLFAMTTLWRDTARGPRLWMLPAALSAGFLMFTLQAVIAEGPVGFWAEHTRNLWGNQIWFDLLLAISIGWFLIVPQAKALGMRPLPWLVLIVCTGCIGFLMMLSRLLYLRENMHRTAAGQRDGDLHLVAWLTTITLAG